MKPMMRFANADPRPVRTLWWCALAIAISFVVLSIARTRLSKEPDRVFAVESLQPAAQFNDSWLAMNTAFNYLRSPHSTPVYTKVFIQDADLSITSLRGPRPDGAQHHFARSYSAYLSGDGRTLQPVPHDGVADERCRRPYQ